MLGNRVSLLGLGVLFLANISAASDLLPDHRPDHCAAFMGSWKNGTCNSRYEYQQRPIGRDFQQFCEARGGLYEVKQTSKGRRRTCRNAISEQGLHHYPFDEFANSDVYLDVERSCLNEDYSLKDCEVADSAEVNEWFDYTNAPAYGSTAYNIVVETILDGFANLKKNPKGELIRKNMGSALKAKIAKEKLNTCQQACLTKCATATILDYDHKIGPGPHPYSTEYLYTHRQGVCTEYSRLNKDLADLAGTLVAMRGTLKGRHAYSYYKINGRWYYGEPQNKSCRFFHSKSTLNRYKQAIANYTGGWTNILPAPKRRGRSR